MLEVLCVGLYVFQSGWCAAAVLRVVLDRNPFPSVFSSIATEEVRDSITLAHPEKYYSQDADYTTIEGL